MLKKVILVIIVAILLGRVGFLLVSKENESKIEE